MDSDLIWAGVGLCLVQSALFSGLNLALLGLSRLQLEVEAQAGHRGATRILGLRRDSNFLLTTVLWGNVSVNCLLTLLTDSVLSGVGAFLFSTVGITIVGEIIPQAFFSRHAMSVGAALTPFIRFYQFVLYPVARPTAALLDRFLGQEEVQYFRERDLREVIRQHMIAEDTDLEFQEGLGAINFLVLDDLPAAREGEPVDPESVIPLPMALDLPLFPTFDRDPTDEFLRHVHASGKKWVILTDEAEQPRLVLDADAFLRDTLLEERATNPYQFCHRPLVVTDSSAPLGPLLRQLRVQPERSGDDVIDHDIMLVWTDDQRRVITGADLLGRILRGIPRLEPPPSGLGPAPGPPPDPRPA